MASNQPILLPNEKKILSELGENLKLARLRRKLSAQQVAERAGMSRPTLLSIEKGSPGVSLGYILKVLSIFGLESDMLLLGRDDELGRKWQDARLVANKRAPKRGKKDEHQ